MKTRKNNIYVVLLMFFIAQLFITCASTPKQPLWDIQEIQRVVIMPFEVFGQSDLERKTAKELHSGATECFTGDRFIIVDRVDQADAIFKGELIDYVGQRAGENYNSKIIISYSLVRTSDGSIVGENTVYYTNLPGSSSIGPIRLLQRHLSQELGD